jgi:mRNA-degrading endonuclease toxin of MazEF toxin-antitoxin module
MISSEERGLTYAVFKGNKNIGHDDLGFPVSGEIIRIVPVIIVRRQEFSNNPGAVIVAASVAWFHRGLG